MPKEITPKETAKLLGWTEQAKSKLRLVLRKTISRCFITSEQIEKIISETFE